MSTQSPDISPALVDDQEPLAEVDRRSFLRMLGASALPLAAQACVSEEEEPSEDFGGQFRGVNPVLETPCTILRAKSNQDIVEDDEELSIDHAFLDYVNVGDQCRIIRNDGEYAIFTVAEKRNEKYDDRIRMGMRARTRLGTSRTFSATFSTCVVTPGLTEQEAKDQSEFTEMLVDDGVSTSLVAIAPHGGKIEPYTHEQAELLQSLLADKGASSWVTKGYRSGGGAYDRWHITSTAISRNSFPLLDSIADRGFAYAVSFHGMSTEMVLIGGAAPEELRVAVRDAIRAVMVNSGIEVDLSTAVDLYTGDSPKNVVNWLTADGFGGIQIEQSKRAREFWGTQIVEAIAGVFDGLI